MSFFKPSGRTPPKTIARLQALIWVLIYGGLLTLVLGVATRRVNTSLGSRLMVVGVIVAAVGVILIYVRSRLHESQ